MKLTPEISEKLIEILGSEKIDAVYEIMKSKPVSFSMLKFMMKRNNILNDLFKGKPISVLVKEYGISKMTMYRIIKKYREKQHLKEI